ncbi:hypothetical protein [Phenylobacterium sp.]|uniref:terminase small subunit-like protein n=1 Tax=Phenylobacterium sp. TaxID=1871053 RepID=UPI002FC7A661
MSYNFADRWIPPRDRRVPPMDHRSGAVGSQYRREIGEVICARMEVVETIRSIAADPDMPSYATIFHWRKVQPEFAAMYDRVRAHLAEGRVQNRRLKHVSDAWRIPHEIRLGLRRHWVSGKKSTYDRAWAKRFCKRVANGEAVSAIVKDPKMPSSKQVYSWLKRKEEFLDMYIAAKAEHRDWTEFEIENLVMSVEPHTLKETQEEVARLEAWIGRLTPKTYRAR